MVEAVGITQSALSQLENGLVTSSSHLPSIAKYLGVDSYWLQTGIESSNNNFQIIIVKVMFLCLPILCVLFLLDYVQAGLFHEVGYGGVNPLGTTWTTYQGARPECVFL